MNSLPQVDEGGFAEQVLSATKPVLVDFWAPWCGPCRMVHPELEALAAERDDLLIVSVNTDDAPGLSGEYQIMSIPAMLVFRDGELIGRMVGARPRAQIEAEVDRLLGA